MAWQFRVEMEARVTKGTLNGCVAPVTLALGAVQPYSISGAQRTHVGKHVERSWTHESISSVYENLFVITTSAVSLSLRVVVRNHL